MKKRRQAIVDLVNQAGEITIPRLHEAFPTVSEVTLRKDLRCLDEEKRLVRVFGGAKSIHNLSGYAINFSVRNMLHQEEKQLIGAKAAKLIPPGVSIYLGAGTTCSAFARQMPQQPLHIFTDGLNIALDLPSHPEIHAELFGGVIDRRLMRLAGPEVLDAVNKLHFDYAFISVLGFHPDRGFSCSSEFTPMLRRAIARSDKLVILMDSSKVNYAKVPRNIPLDEVDIVISDDKLPEDIRTILTDHNITIY